ncbi:hypothetical protein [Phenylobacterium sp.]|uniref:hypothetical protein n=1 Tax=Phenylobacterium sp. TaxID=1871053 RepID=UPI002FD8920B
MPRPDELSPLTGVQLMGRNYEAFLHHARRHGYCDPFVPFVGDRYFAHGRRIVYCGVAPRYDEALRFAGPGEAAEWSRKVVLDHNIKSAFWRLIDRILQDIEPDRPAMARRERIVWTNLSKLCSSDKATAPSDADAELRALNVEQLRCEMASLRPDLLLCVSGSQLQTTGVQAFGDLQCGPLTPNADQTWVRQLPTGGVLYWTMHPQGKSRAWVDAVLGDLAALLRNSQS